MSNPFEDAIAELERQIEEAERKANDLRNTINSLCAAAGLPPRYPEVSIGGGPGTKITQIRDDTFYGKKQTPAMRDYLVMRKAQGLGPAKPRDIFEALKSGGYQFESKDDEIALVSMRALLRAQPQIFHKLPQGTWGLTDWYPEAKRQKVDDDRPVGKKRRGRPPKEKQKKRGSPPKAARAPLPDTPKAPLQLVGPETKEGPKAA